MHVFVPVMELIVDLGTHEHTRNLKFKFFSNHQQQRQPIVYLNSLYSFSIYCIYCFPFMIYHEKRDNPPKPWYETDVAGCSWNKVIKSLLLLLSMWGSNCPDRPRLYVGYNCLVDHVGWTLIFFNLKRDIMQSRPNLILF